MSTKDFYCYLRFNVFDISKYDVMGCLKSSLVCVLDSLLCLPFGLNAYCSLHGSVSINWKASIKQREKNSQKCCSSKPVKAFADDYAFLIEGLLDLYEVTFDENLLKFASELQKQFDERFWDTDNNAGYFLSETDPSIMTRFMEGSFRRNSHFPFSARKRFS